MFAEQYVEKWRELSLSGLGFSTESSIGDLQKASMLHFHLSFLWFGRQPFFRYPDTRSGGEVVAIARLMLGIEAPA